MRANFPETVRNYPATVTVAGTPEVVFDLSTNPRKPAELSLPVRFTMQSDTAVTLSGTTYISFQRVDSVGTNLEVGRLTSSTSTTDFYVSDQAYLGALMGSGENFIVEVVGAAWTGKTLIMSLVLGLDR